MSTNMFFRYVSSTPAKKNRETANQIDSKLMELNRYLNACVDGETGTWGLV